MTWLYVISGILLFFIWLFTRKITIGVGFCDKPSFFLKLLFFKLSSSPDAKPKQEAEKTAEKAKKDAAKPEKAQKPSEKKTVSEYLEIFTAALKDVISKLKKYLFLEKYIIKADIGTDDAAKTALLYGSACSAASSLWALVCSIKRRTNKPDMIMTEITPDFISESVDFYADIVISIRIWQALSLGMTALGIYNKIKR